MLATKCSAAVFLIIVSIFPYLFAVKDRIQEEPSGSSSGAGNLGTTFIDKHYGKGAKGTIVQVPLPEKDAILKRTKNKRPANYETLEQKVARTSKHYIRKGKFTNQEEAIRAAKEYHRMRGQQSNVWRKEKGKRTKKNPPGYGSKNQWLSRRVESLIAETDNGIDDHEHAEQVAKEQYAERLKRKNEAKKIKARQLRDLGQQQNNQ